MPRRLFIGDVHGHYDGLRRLWDLISPDPDDAVYFVGDLIDRGPKSAQVVDFVRRYGTGCVRGNHEQLLLDAFVDGSINLPTMQGWLYSGGQMTLSSYQGSVETLKADVLWLKSLPLYIDLGNVWLVHAGVNPSLSIAQQSSYELCWIRDTFHSSTAPYFPDKQIITGHTITFTFPGVPPGQIIEGLGWSDIDTGVYHSRSGWLTALDWDHQTVYQINVFEGTQRIRTYADSVVKLDPKSLKRRSRTVVVKS